MGPTGASCKVPSMFLLDPNAFSLYREGEGGVWQCVCGPGMRLAGAEAAVTKLCSCPSSWQLLLPGGAQGSLGGLITAK